MVYLVALLDHIEENHLPCQHVKVDTEEEYMVLRIEDSQMNHNQMQHLTNWTVYDSLM